MASVTIRIDKNNNWFWSHDGFVALITKLIEYFLPVNYVSDIYTHKENLHSMFCTWKIPPFGISMEILSRRDFNTVVHSLEKDRKYLDTLVEEKQQEEFIEDHIGVWVFKDLKYYVDETLRHCYMDPRYEAEINLE